MISAHKSHREPLVAFGTFPGRRQLCRAGALHGWLQWCTAEGGVPKGFQRVDTVDGGFVLAKWCTSTSKKVVVVQLLMVQRKSRLAMVIFWENIPMFDKISYKKQVVQDFFHQQVGGVNPRWWAYNVGGWRLKAQPYPATSTSAVAMKGPC